MAHVWMQGDSKRWSVLELERSALDIGRFPPTPVEDTGAEAVRKARLLLVPLVEGGKAPSWALLWNRYRQVYVDSIPLTSGVRVLSDREEIRLAGRTPIYFAAVSPPKVTVHADTERTIECPRCGRPITPGCLVVVCPQCGITFHQDPGDPMRQCWTYAERCSCSMATDLDADFLWSPEDL